MRRVARQYTRKRRASAEEGESSRKRPRLSAPEVDDSLGETEIRQDNVLPTSNAPSEDEEDEREQEEGEVKKTKGKEKEKEAEEVDDIEDDDEDESIENDAVTTPTTIADHGKGKAWAATSDIGDFSPVQTIGDLLLARTDVTSDGIEWVPPHLEVIEYDRERATPEGDALMKAMCAFGQTRFQARKYTSRGEGDGEIDVDTAFPVNFLVRRADRNSMC